MEPDAALARRLVAEQFPQWSRLPVAPVLPGGNDNRTFRLGDGLTVRLPSHDRYSAGELKEHVWLPRLAPHLPAPVPEIVAAGQPSAAFPRPWSVRRWLPGEQATSATAGEQFARELGEFLVALRAVDASAGPPAGPDTFHRGGDLAVYDAQARASIAALNGDLAGERDALLTLWDRALATRWDRPPVWFHGDVAAGNLLVRDGALAGVIDFGQSAVGDPACDLAVAWTLLPRSARAAFADAMELDESTWDRGRGWALWKASIQIAHHDPAAPAARGVLLTLLLD